MVNERIDLFHGKLSPILPQPDNFTCGPTSLHSVLKFYGDTIPLEEVIRMTPRMPGGGTLGVMLAKVALARGLKTTIYTYNLEVFDPTWFRPGVDLAAKLRAQAEVKPANPRLQTATRFYLEYIAAGGEVRFEELTARLILKYLRMGKPILTGLSSTYLYLEARELENTEPHDVLGEPAGHFVVLAGFDAAKRTILVADPLHPNPLSSGQLYELPTPRVVGAILLGVLTYDANLLILEPTPGGAQKEIQ